MATQYRQLFFYRYRLQLIINSGVSSLNPLQRERESTKLFREGTKLVVKGLCSGALDQIIIVLYFLIYTATLSLNTDVARTEKYRKLHICQIGIRDVQRSIFYRAPGTE